MRSIAMTNSKGGVGKTTCSMNIGVGLARQGKTVTIMDLDPQGGLTRSFGITPETLEKDISHFLDGTSSFDEVVVEAEGVMILPASYSLITFEMDISTIPGKENILRRRLPGIKDTDYLIIDCPPTQNVLNYNALAAVDEVIVPVQTYYLALPGLRNVIDVIDLVKQNLNHMLELGGILLNFYDSRERTSRMVDDALREEFGDKVFESRIRKNTSIALAPAYHKSIFAYEKNSLGSCDFEKLCVEIEERGVR